MPIKTVIFDLDGTVTRQYLDFDAIRREMNLPPETDTILEAMEKMTPEQRHQARLVLQEHEDRAAQNVELNPHADQILRELSLKGINIGVLTRNTKSNAEIIASRFCLRFDAIVDRDHGPPKPDPHGVLWLCEFFRTVPAETMLVGDYLHDLLCAKAAGATAILLKTHPNGHEFTKYADYVINSLEQLPRIIENHEHENTV